MGQCVGHLIWSAAHISACQNTTYSCCLSVAPAPCIYFYTVSAVDTLCAGGPFILLCLKGNSDDILGGYSYT